MLTGRSLTVLSSGVLGTNTSDAIHELCHGDNCIRGTEGQLSRARLLQSLGHTGAAGRQAGDIAQAQTLWREYKQKIRDADTRI